MKLFLCLEYKYPPVDNNNCVRDRNCECAEQIMSQVQQRMRSCAGDAVNQVTVAQDLCI